MWVKFIIQIVVIILKWAPFNTQRDSSCVYFSAWRVSCDISLGDMAWDVNCRIDIVVIPFPHTSKQIHTEQRKCFHYNLSECFVYYSVTNNSDWIYIFMGKVRAKLELTCIHLLHPKVHWFQSQYTRRSPLFLASHKAWAASSLVVVGRLILNNARFSLVVQINR